MTHLEKNPVRIGLLVVLLAIVGGIGAILYFAYTANQLEDQIAIMFATVLATKVFELVCQMLWQKETEKPKK